MKKKVKMQMQWHVAVIAAIIFLLSVASWLQFAGNMGSLIIYRFSDKKAAETISDATDYNTVSEPALPAQQTRTGLLHRACSSIDAAIDTLDSMWSVYRKSSLSKIDSRITYYMLGEISSVQVVAGSDGWLFYRSGTESDTIADFEGTNRYSAEELETIAQAALFAQKGLESRGIRFALTVAPNKENVYWEYMPETYVHAEKSSTDILIGYLSQRGVNVVSPKPALLEKHLTSQLYYSYDTHWNQLGAYIGVRDTLASWDLSMPELSDRTVLSSELNGQYHYCGEDDLAEMIGLRSVFSDEKEYEVEGTVLMDWESFESEQTADEISHYHNETAFNKKSVFLVGDSFRSAMVPALREQFADVYVTQRSCYEAKMLDEVRPDYLIAEYVERYSGHIGKISSLVG